MTFEELIVQQRPHIDQVVRDLSRRHYFAAAEVEELRAAVVRALERNEFELLRAFDGRSTWETYLTTVITREFFLFQNALWGRWRPTPTAQRLGAAAVLLEELVVRDRMPVERAIDVMRTTHHVDLPRHRISEMAATLRLADVAVARHGQHTAVSPSLTDAGLETALRDALRQLSPDDRLILELRFRDRQPLTRIATMMKMEVRPLQRRLDAVKSAIRASLLGRGVAGSDVAALLEHAESDGSHSRHQWWHTVLSRPSK